MYTMQNGFGEILEIIVAQDGTTVIKLDGETRREFSTEDKAYNWAYRLGFRE